MTMLYIDSDAPKPLNHIFLKKNFVTDLSMTLHTVYKSNNEKSVKTYFVKTKYVEMKRESNLFFCLS